MSLTQIQRLCTPESGVAPLVIIGDEFYSKENWEEISVFGNEKENRQRIGNYRVRASPT